VLALRRETGRAQQAAAARRYGPGHRARCAAAAVVGRLLPLLLLWLLLLLLLLWLWLLPRLLLVTVGHAKTAKVHQPAGLRAVVLRLGARQVVVACNICNTRALASVKRRGTRRGR